MTPFQEALSTSVTQFELTGSRVLVGISGGADSVALLRGLHEFQQERDLEITAAHLNHQLRGSQSDDDAAWVVSLCATLDIRLILDSRDVGAIAKQEGCGLEETARTLRYEFLTATAHREHCTHIAVAHTANDQVETVLHHVLRGTGIAGLAGIPATRPLSDSLHLVRPLMAVTRADIENYLSDIGQDYRTDESNEEQTYTRNRIRHALLPLLKQGFNPQVEQALLRLSRQATGVQATVEILACRLLEATLVDQNESTCRLDCTLLRNEPVHLVRECLALLWKRQNWPRQRMGFEEWDHIADMVTADELATSTHMLPGSIEVARRGNLLVVRQLG